MSEPTNVPGMAQWPEPVTMARIAALAASNNLSFTQAEGGERLRTRWGDNVIEVALSTKKHTVLRVLGLSNAKVSRDRANDLATFANNWHRERVWPTLVWTGDADGDINLRSVFTQDLTAGATDTQLLGLIRLGLGSSAKALDAVREAMSRGTTEPGPA